MPVGESRSKPKKSATRQRVAQALSLTDSLAEAAWSEADAALAEALAAYDEMGTARRKGARDDAFDRLGQALSLSARRRGLARVGELDAHVPYDPARHELNAPVATTPKTVRIQARGVTRGGEVLISPRVAPIEKKRP